MMELAIMTLATVVMVLLFTVFYVCVAYFLDKQEERGRRAWHKKNTTFGD